MHWKFNSKFISIELSNIIYKLFETVRIVRNYNQHNDIYAYIKETNVAFLK